MKRFLVLILFALPVLAWAGEPVDAVLASSEWAKFKALVAENYVGDYTAAALEASCVKDGPTSGLPDLSPLERCVDAALKYLDPHSGYYNAAAIAALPAQMAADERVASELRVAWLPSDVGYVHIGEFGEKTSREIAQKLAEHIRPAPTSISVWVLDLRGSPGGSIRGLQFAGAMLVGDAVPMFDVRTRKEVIDVQTCCTIDALGRDLVMAGTLMQSGFVVVLVDRHTAAGAEGLALMLRARRGAIIVGERTAGSANVHTFLALDKQGAIKIKTGTMSGHGGDSWEGTGLRSDEPLNLEPVATLAWGDAVRDTWLQAALSKAASAKESKSDARPDNQTVTVITKEQIAQAARTMWTPESYQIAETSHLPEVARESFFSNTAFLSMLKKCFSLKLIGVQLPTGGACDAVGCNELKPRSTLELWQVERCGQRVNFEVDWREGKLVRNEQVS